MYVFKIMIFDVPRPSIYNQKSVNYLTIQTASTFLASTISMQLAFLACSTFVFDVSIIQSGPTNPLGSTFRVVLSVLTSSVIIMS